MSRLGINLGLALGLVVAIAFIAWRLQLAVVNYGTTKWNDGYAKAVGEFRVAQANNDAEQYKKQAQALAEGAASAERTLSVFGENVGNLSDVAARLRMRGPPTAASGNSSGAGNLSASGQAASGVHEGSGSANDRLALLPWDRVIDQAVSCDTDRERLLGLQQWERDREASYDAFFEQR